MSSLDPVPLDGEITSDCPLCGAKLDHVKLLGNIVACYPCGCEVYASIVTTFITPEGVTMWKP